MITFDEALPALVRICEGTPHFRELTLACAVRDLRGRLRLIIDPDPTKPEPDVPALEAALRAGLGDYFATPIWSTTGQKEQGRLAKAVLQQPGVEDWRPTYDDPVTGTSGVLAQATWRKYERRVSKDAWLDASRPRPPWPLGEGPGIATFYSFKGGVGRSTALVSCAWQLARAGKRVVVIDLDLEAPGLGALLGAETARGALDFLVDHFATGAIVFDRLVAPATALAEDADRVRVIPAGRLGGGYLEKLARLDYAAATHGSGDAEDSPVEHALRALLFATRRERPDVILIDARAGLHDLAGISLHRLAHVDVLVTRASEQAHQGFDLALEALSRRKGPRDLSCIVAHAMAPLEGSREAPFEERDVRERVFSSFRRHVYKGAHTLDIDEPGQHRPIVLQHNPQLVSFASLGSVEHHLLGRDYRALQDRLVALLFPFREVE
jgi:MinD-like ATPase involved in chromosome partitioning or flagellar assembly